MPDSAAVRSTSAITALTVIFGLNGFLMAQVMSRMPSLRDQVDASPGQLGIALFGVGLGSIVAMPWTARLTERFGSPAVVAGAATLAITGWAALSLVPNPAWMTLNTFILGTGVGVWDVAMNVQGNTLEHLHKRVLMPRLHAAFSAGTVGGALVGSGFALADVPLIVQLPTMSLFGLVVLFACVRRLVPDAHRHAGDHADRPVRRSRITRLEIVLGILTFATALGEGAANDWLALVLVDERGAAEAVGALTFAGFNLAMTVGRLGGGKLIRARGRAPVVRLAGIAAVIGVVMVAVVPSLVAAITGGLLWGLGVSVVFPAAMSAAGEVPGRGPRAIGVVATIGYAGFLAGAPTIGLVAEVVGLGRALLIVAGVCALIVVLAPAARERARERTNEAGAADER